MKRKGFTLILVMAFLGLVAALMMVLADVSDSMIAETNRSLAQARQRNLDSSAMAWLRQNRARPAEELAKGVELDPAELSGARLHVQWTGDGPAEVSTETRAGRLDLKNTVLLPLPGAGKP
jgi:hypothetical protein